MTILQHVQDMTAQLSESEAKVAQTILADPTSLERSTITRLAQAAGTSTSAVLRFCHSLGYAGYKEFRYELASELQHAARDEADRDPLLAAAEGMSEAVRRLGDLDRSQLALLADHIVHARCVFCLGIHRSYLPAEKLRMDLEDLGILAVSLRDIVQATHTVNVMGRQSCLVIFSETGGASSYRTALDAGIAEQGHSWLVTSSPRAALAGHVEQAIVLPSAKRFGAGAVDEHAVALAFVELLMLTLKEGLEHRNDRETDA